MVFVVVGFYEGVRAFVRVIGKVVVSAVSCYTKAGVPSLPVEKHTRHNMGVVEPLCHNLKNGFRAPSSNFVMSGYVIACSSHKGNQSLCGKRAMLGDEGMGGLIVIAAFEA